TAAGSPLSCAPLFDHVRCNGCGPFYPRSLSPVSPRREITPRKPAARKLFQKAATTSAGYARTRRLRGEIVQAAKRLSSLRAPAEWHASDRWHPAGPTRARDLATEKSALTPREFVPR